MTKAEINRAATLLRAEARFLREYGTIAGTWDRAHEDYANLRANYDELIDLARKLRGLARMQPSLRGFPR